MLGMNLTVLLLGIDDCRRIYVIIYDYVINIELIKHILHINYQCLKLSNEFIL